MTLHATARGFRSAPTNHKRYRQRDTRLAELNLYDPIEFDPVHAERRMRERKITRNMVLESLKSWHTRTPAARRPGVPIIGDLYIGRVGGRDLKVWIEPDSDPVYVRSVAWKDEDDRVSTARNLQ